MFHWNHLTSLIWLTDVLIHILLNPVLRGVHGSLVFGHCQVLFTLSFRHVHAVFGVHTSWPLCIHVWPFQGPVSGLSYASHLKGSNLNLPHPMCDNTGGGFSEASCMGADIWLVVVNVTTHTTSSTTCELRHTCTCKSCPVSGLR